jgi:hypothetical protein
VRLASPMLEFLDVSAVVLHSRVYERQRRRVHGRVEKNPEKPGDRRGGCRGRGRSLLRSDVVRYVDARAEACFRKCRCAVLKPSLMKLFRSSAREGDRGGEGGGGGGRGWGSDEVKRGSRRKASHGVGKIAARLQELLEKLIIFPVS